MMLLSGKASRNSVVEELWEALNHKYINILCSHCVHQVVLFHHLMFMLFFLMKHSHKLYFSPLGILFWTQHRYQLLYEIFFKLQRFNLLSYIKICVANLYHCSYYIVLWYLSFLALLDFYILEYWVFVDFIFRYLATIIKEWLLSEWMRKNKTRDILQVIKSSQTWPILNSSVF